MESASITDLLAHMCRFGRKVALLRWRDRLEQAAIRFEVDQRRAVEAVEAAHQEPAALDLLQHDDRRTDRIGPDLRSAAPSINIQSINFAFGSADIPRSEYRKVRQIARAMEQLLNRRRRAVFLIEGHTDAVGSAASNQILSERRAESLKRLLVQEFGIPSRALETVGYGEDYLLVQTLSEEWRNRRVTLRRIDEFVR